jgi:uncharacterized iron-regulated protein
MFALILAVQATDPYAMDFTGQGLYEAPMGWSRTSSGEAASPQAIAAAAAGHKFVLVGESHDELSHHRRQAEVIEALTASGREVTIGMEMFTRDNQGSLGGWPLGEWSQEEFIEKSNWKTQWGFDYALYAPIFSASRTHGLPLVALNLPRDWVRRVGRGGPGALTPEEARWAPDIDTSNESHLKLFTAMIGGHPLEGERGRNMYAAQVSWDEGMAQTAHEWALANPNPKRVMVIIAGSGHTMHGLGINYRLKRKGWSSIHALPITASEPRTLARSAADFVWLGPSES